MIWPHLITYGYGYGYADAASETEGQGWLPRSMPLFPRLDKTKASLDPSPTASFLSQATLPALWWPGRLPISVSLFFTLRRCFSAVASSRRFWKHQIQLAHEKYNSQKVHKLVWKRENLYRYSSKEFNPHEILFLSSRKIRVLVLSELNALFLCTHLHRKDVLANWFCLPKIALY
jgi:hypothetical protein